MLLECQNCGAPLDAPANARMVKCNYCDRTNRIEQMRTMAQQTPQGWRPPPVWTPPPHFPARSVPIQFHQTATRTASRALVIAPVILLSVIGMGVAGAISVVSNRSTSSTSYQEYGQQAAPVTPVSKGEAWNGASTLKCGMNEEVVLENKTVNLDDTLIDANLNCKLKIKNCRLTGTTIVKASMNAEIEIIGSTLEAKRYAVDGSQHVKLRVLEQSTLKSEETAIKVGQVSEVRVKNSTVEAAETAIEMGQSSNLTIEASKVIGKQRSLDVGQVSEVRIEGSTIEGERELSRSVKVREK